ncbi:MAG: hypothetical protein AAGK14_08575 [Verrucomicrobiota bacterium]
MRKKTLFRVVVISMLSIGLGLGAYFAYWQYAHYTIQHFSNLLQKNPDKVPADELRASLHRTLAFPIYGYRDAYGVAASVGNEETVALLIDCLRWWPDVRVDEAVIDSRFFLNASLRQLTGADPGVNHADWKRWHQQRLASGEPVLGVEARQQ